MIAFASDLDRTLIYSWRFLNEDVTALPIERYEGKIISYMTEEALQQLHELAEMMTFIPVTTRTEAQFKRISIFQDQIQPEYAVTSNGGKVFVRGERDQQWTEQIALEMAQLMLSVDDAFSYLQQFQHEKWAKTIKVADELFVYCVLHEEHFSDAQLAVFVDYFENQGWVVNKQGRKVYFLPECIGKEKALRYLHEQYGVKTVFAAGDAKLDQKMIVEAQHGICPLHGEIAVSSEQDYTVTEREGMCAAEDILTQVRNQAVALTEKKPSL